MLAEIVKFAILVAVQKYKIDNGFIASIYSTLVLSGVIQKYYGIQQLLGFHYSTIVAVFCNKYFSDSCLVQGSQ